jgi:hypothetical protein
MPLMRKFFGKDNESSESFKGEVAETREAAK